MKQVLVNIYLGVTMCKAMFWELFTDMLHSNGEGAATGSTRQGVKETRLRRWSDLLRITQWYKVAEPRLETRSVSKDYVLTSLTQHCLDPGKDTGWTRYNAHPWGASNLGCSPSARCSNGLMLVIPSHTMKSVKVSMTRVEKLSNHTNPHWQLRIGQNETSEHWQENTGGSRREWLE